MGLLDGITSEINAAKSKLEQALTFKKDVDPPYPDPDFKGGFIIQEIENGERKEKITLLGNMMPFQPFNYGGEHNIKKDFYAGNSEPVVHVLNPMESDLVINGRLKDKKYQDKSARGVSYELSKQIDAFRIRGNLVELKLGEWKRFGFIVKTDFSLRTKQDIDYRITFSLVGFNQPRQCIQVKTSKGIPFAINKDLINQLASFQAQIDQIPASVPQSLADILNDAISDVAGAVAAVTDFVDTVVSQVEDVTAVLNRAAGLIKYAQGEVIRFKRRIGQISYSLSSLTGIQVGSRYQATAFISGVQSSGNDIQSFLATLRSRFAALSASTPQARVRIKSGDTLQNLANRFYKNSLEWEKIYDHNKLTSTELEIGVVLEIPRL